MSDELIFRTAVDLSGLNEGTEELKAILMSTGEAAAAASERASAAFSDFGTSIEEAYANVDAQVASALESLNASTEKSAEVVKTTSASSADAVTSSSAQIEEAFTKVAETTDIVAAAYQQLAVAASVNTQAQAGLKDAYKQLSSTALESGQSAKILAQYEREAAEASEQLTLAKKNLAETIAYETELSQGAVVEIQAFAAAEEELAVASSHTATSISAASGLIREFEGTVPIRAVERFIATTLGLGPILQAAFPIIGAVALGEVLIDVAGKVVDLYEKFFTFKELREEVTKEAEADAEKLGHALATAAQLRHETGIRDNPIGTLKKDISDANQEVDYFNRRIQIAHDNLASFLAIRESGNYLGHGTSEEENDLNISSSRTALQTLKGEADTVQAKVDDLKSQLNKQTGKADSKLLKAESQADRALLRKYEEDLDILKIDHAVTLKEEEDFWTARIATFSDKSGEYKTVLDRITSLTTESARKAHEVIQKFKNQQAEASAKDAHDRPEMERIASEFNAGGTPQQLEQYQVAVDKGREAQVKANEALQAAQISADLANGAITPLGAAYEQQELHARTYAEQLKLLDAELKRIRDDWSMTLAQRNTKGQEIENQKTVVGGQQKVAAFNDQNNINRKISQPYISAFNTINSHWLQLQNSLIFGTKSVSAAFANLGVSLLQDVAGNFERLLAKQVEYEIQRTVIHAIANETTVASDATAAAQTLAISAQKSLKQITHEASVAAAKAWAAFADIPIVGPVLGAVAAAVTFAGVEALAAFETGGLIPNTGVALVHKGEAVLPEHLTSFLLNMASPGNTTTSTSSSRISQTNNYNGSGDRQFQRQVSRNGGSLLRAVKKHVRGGGKV